MSAATEPKKKEKVKILLDHLSFLHNRQAKEDFASKCNTSIGNIIQIAYGHRGISVELAVKLDKASDGAIRFDHLLPDVDWKYIAEQVTSRVS